MALNEYLLSISDLTKPKIITDKEAIYTLITRLILLEPGTIQSHPDMGVGIVSRYRYSDSKNIETLKTDIAAQIATYLPDLAANDVSVIIKDKAIVIRVTANSVVYETTFNTITKTLGDL